MLCSAADLALKSPARLSLCCCSASWALRCTVSARAFLSPRCGTRSTTRRPRSPDSQLRDLVGVGRQARHQHLPRHRIRATRRPAPTQFGLLAVELGEELLDQLQPPRSPPGSRRVHSDFSTTQPRWPRTRPPRTWNTWTAASRSSSANATTSASVPSPSTTACFSSARRSADEIVAQPGGPLEVEFARRPRSSGVPGRGRYRSVLPDRKSQKSSTILRCSSALTRPTHGAEHLSM